LEELNKSEPTKKLMLPPLTQLPPDHILHFLADPLNLAKETCVRNLIELPRAPKMLLDEKIS
jgi:hypothetical protein